MKAKDKFNKGITLVALVITIIILLILATISIQALTSTGLFQNANKAKLEAKRGQIKEWLSLNLMEVQTTNYDKTDSEILEIARGKAEKSEELKKLGKRVNVDGEISTEEDGQTVPPYFDVIVDNDMYKVSMEEQEFIGEVGKIVPSVDFSATTTSKSITLKITTKRSQGGTVECYIKGENDSNYGTAQKATDNQYTFDNLEQGKKYTVKVVVTSGNGQTAEKEKEYMTEKAVNNAIPGSTTHTASAITYSWADLSTIAQLISNNINITSDTAEVTVTLNGETKTLGVGDTIAVAGETVRILGFNHDPLTDSNAYGTKTGTGKAGISFEYVDFVIDNSAINPNNNNTNGWAAMPLRTTLNGTVYDSLSIKNYIKAVNKEYITTYNTGAKSTCSDKLWLLSCGEIWDNGYNGGNTRGYAMATEGSQYKYYKTNLGSTSYSKSTNVTKKPNTSSPYDWWLRSPSSTSSERFCNVGSGGNCCIYSFTGYDYGVAPGFSI